MKAAKLWTLPLRRIFASAQIVGSTLFSPRYLLFTNTAVSTGLSVAGDVLRQKYKSGTQKQDKPALDKHRTGKMAICGFLSGPTGHYWYIFLDRWFPGQCAKTIVKKVAMDQCIGSPIFIVLYLVTVGLLDGKMWDSLKEDLSEKGVWLFIGDFFIWIPAQIFNFSVLPSRFRLLFDNTVSLFADFFYSYMSTNILLKNSFFLWPRQRPYHIKRRIRISPQYTSDNVEKTYELIYQNALKTLIGPLRISTTVIGLGTSGFSSGYLYQYLPTLDQLDIFVHASVIGACLSFVGMTNWLSRYYVLRIYYNVNVEEFIAVYRTFFGQVRHLKYSNSDISICGNSDKHRQLYEKCTLMIKNRPVHVRASHFLQPKYYNMHTRL